MKLANGIIILAAITMGTLAACDSTVTEGPETPQRPAVTPQVGSTCSNLDYSGTYGVSLSTESHDLCWDFVTDVIELEVGRHEIAAVSNAGAPRTASIQILPGSTRSLLELLPPPPTPARVTPTGTWVLVAVGGAAAATGVALLALAEERRSELSNTSTDDEGNVTSITEQRAHDIRDEVDRLTVAGAITAGVGAASLVGAVIWTLVGRGEDTATSRPLVPTAKTSPRVGVRPGPGFGFALEVDLW